MWTPSITSFKDDPCSTSQLGNATQAYPTPQTAGSVPSTSCPPTNATKGSDGVTAPVPGDAAGDTANGGAGDSWSNGVGITLVVLGNYWSGFTHHCSPDNFWQSKVQKESRLPLWHMRPDVPHHDVVMVVGQGTYRSPKGAAQSVTPPID